ncbi:putative neuropeptide Y receptor type 6 [Exaiptasia diaphana]|uniref:G-protein coupled receptors family 1 profile domain-containing protein n=1 Tax=Exaiptasia diaphana TaxID=2652724 RepID=A0A913X6S3_EXADI|nr:putative neuropeptide Y receptor type 6 [Exaiptasia diaphana]
MLNFTEEDSGTNTSVCPQELDSSLVKIVKTFAYCIMLILALGGNVILVCVVSSQRKLRTTTNCLICNMAISDLLVPIFAMPRTIVEIHLGYRRWLVTGTIGLALCKVIYFLQDVSTAVSVLSLSIITIDRFYAVVLPESRTPIKGRVKPVIAGIWMTAMLMHCPYFYTFKLVENKGLNYCALLWPNTIDTQLATQVFFLTLIVLLYFIPFFLIAILQAMIVKRLRNQRLPSFSSSFRQRKRGKRNRNVVHFTLAVIVTFFVCWTPTVVYSFTLIYGANPCIPEIFRFASLFLVQSNSSINFFIYFIFNQNFRKTFKKLFHGRKISLKMLGRAETVQLPVLRSEQTAFRIRTMTCETLPDGHNDFEVNTFKSQVTLKGFKVTSETLDGAKKGLLRSTENAIKNGMSNIDEQYQKQNSAQGNDSISSMELSDQTS